MTGATRRPGSAWTWAAGLLWSDPARGVRAELGGRGLLTHESAGFGERGFAALARVGSGAGVGPGPESDDHARTVGAQAAGGMDALLGPETARALGAAEEDDLARRRLEARLGYGFAVFGGGWTGCPRSVSAGRSRCARRCSAGRLAGGASARGWCSGSASRARGARAWRARRRRSTVSGSGSAGGSRVRGAGTSRCASRARGASRAMRRPRTRSGSGSPRGGEGGAGAGVGAAVRALRAARVREPLRRSRSGLAIPGVAPMLAAGTALAGSSARRRRAAGVSRRFASVLANRPGNGATLRCDGSWIHARAAQPLSHGRARRRAQARERRCAASRGRSVSGGPRL